MFLKGAAGDLFAILHRPTQPTTRGAILFVHPFAEEMNKSRRTVAVQARTLADLGWMVLQVDLFGCGDSAGDISDATWDIWAADVDACADWLHEQSSHPVVLWGLRFGALIAADVAGRRGVRCERLLFWQPMLKGAAMLSALLRQRMVAEFAGSDASVKAGDLRRALLDGESLELSGYLITTTLARSIEAAEINADTALPSVIDWLDVAADVSRPPMGAGPKIRDAWGTRGVDVRYGRVQGDSFWNAGEIVECSALIDATCDQLA